MTIATDAQFDTFKQEFERWQKAFGCEGYNVYFIQAPLDGCYADIRIHQDLMTACVRMANDIEEDDAKCFDPLKCAKHEALHLLVGRLAEDAGERHITEVEINAATEELVNKLLKLIS